jgi:hypothetical protein
MYVSPDSGSTRETKHLRVTSTFGLCGVPESQAIVQLQYAGLLSSKRGFITMLLYTKKLYKKRFRGK